MFEIIIKKLLHCLRGRNARVVKELDKWQDELEIDLILKMLEEYGVKIAFTVTNRFNGNTFVTSLEHASHRGCLDCVYNAIHLDFSKVFKNNRKSGKADVNTEINKILCDLGFEWDGNVATCNKLTF